MALVPHMKLSWVAGSFIQYVTSVAIVNSSITRLVIYRYDRVSGYSLCQFVFIPIGELLRYSLARRIYVIVHLSFGD